MMDDLIRRKDAVSRISDLLVLELKYERLPTYNEVYHAINDIPSAQPKISCSETPNTSDTISRQAAIDAVKKNTFRLTFAEEQNCEGHVAWSANAVYSDVMEGALLELPSVHPERKTGRWIYGEHDVTMCDGYHCSECGFFVPWDYKREFIDFIKDYNFCPNCGSPMLKEGEG